MVDIVLVVNIINVSVDHIIDTALFGPVHGSLVFCEYNSGRYFNNDKGLYGLTARYFNNGKGLYGLMARYFNNNKVGSCAGYFNNGKGLHGLMARYFNNNKVGSCSGYCSNCKVDLFGLQEEYFG